MSRYFTVQTIVTASLAAALVLALSVGGATAAGLITGRQIKDHSIGIVDLKKKAQALLHGQRGPQGPAGPAGPAGPPGQSSTIAYARVAKTGAVIAASSRNVAQTNVVRTAAGQYCIRGLNPAIKSAVASPAGGKAIGAVIGGMTVNCSFVISLHSASGARVDSPFYVQFAA